MKNDFRKPLRLKQAYKNIERLKSFYVHMAAYCTVNTILVIVWIFDTFFKQIFWETTFLVTAGLAGLALVAHAVFLFAPKYLLPKDWEEQKFEKLMDGEKETTRDK